MQGQPEGEGKEIKFIYIATRQPRITKYLRKCARQRSGLTWLRHCLWLILGVIQCCRWRPAISICPAALLAEKWAQLKERDWTLLFETAQHLVLDMKTEK